MPTMVGTRDEPASESAPCTVTSGFSPDCSMRKTLQINGFAAPSESVQSNTIEVFDCSPESTFEERRAVSVIHDG